jgi:hypothetical protein
MRAAMMDPCVTTTGSLPPKIRAWHPLARTTRARKREEAAAAAEIARIEEEASAVNHRASSLAEEAADRTKKLGKLWRRYQVGWLVTLWWVDEVWTAGTMAGGRARGASGVHARTAAASGRSHTLPHTTPAHRPVAHAHAHAHAHARARSL